MKPIHDSEMDEVCRTDDLRPTVVDSESAASETPAAIRYDEELRCLTEGTAMFDRGNCVVHVRESSGRNIATAP